MYGNRSTRRSPKRSIKRSPAFCRSRVEKRRSAEFSIVATSARLTEYYGTLKQCPEAVHHLFCERLTEAQAIALRNEGIYSFNTKATATHVIYAVCFLAQKTIQSRILFNCYLDLNSIFRGNWINRGLLSDPFAASLTADLADVMKRSDRSFLIRCIKNEKYPFCLSDNIFDERWLKQIETAYKRRIQMMNAIG